MKLSQRSSSFASKILKHYPSSSQINSCSSDCSQHHKDFQPFQHMHDHRKQRQIFEKPTGEKLENMRYFKQLGNSKFKQKSYEEAAYFYQKAIIYSDYTFPKQSRQISEMEILLQQSNMNLALCLIKNNQWSQALVNLRQALKCEHNQKNQKFKGLALATRKKANYWLAKCYLRQGNFEKAKSQIVSLQTLNNQISTVEQVAQLTRQIDQQMIKSQRKTLLLSKKMFS